MRSRASIFLVYVFRHLKLKHDHCNLVDLTGLEPAVIVPSKRWHRVALHTPLSPLFWYQPRVSNPSHLIHSEICLHLHLRWHCFGRAYGFRTRYLLLEREATIAK